MAATALMTLLSVWLDHGGTAAAFNALLLFFAAAGVLGIFFRERTVPYKSVENTNPVPEGGFQLG